MVVNHIQIFLDEEFYQILSDYWRIRDAKELGDVRSQAHNAVLDAFSARGIFFEDREDAAQQAKQFLKVKQLVGYLLNEIQQFVKE